MREGAGKGRLTTVYGGGTQETVASISSDDRKRATSSRVGVGAKTGGVHSLRTVIPI